MSEHSGEDRWRLDYAARLASDVAAYIRTPQTAEEQAWAYHQAKPDLDDDDVDYEALIGLSDSGGPSQPR